MAVVFIIFFFFCSVFTYSQFEKGTIDTVLSTTFGTNTQFGQSNVFFPYNIYGLPDSSARKDIPSSTEQQICALGMDGSITIGFKGKILRDMPGNDFTVFENSFEFLGDRIFIEPGMVQVSKDGVNFITFPFDSLTLQGCAGLTPTNGEEDPFNPDVSGGNSFDLADVGLDSVIAIRIIDVSSIILNPNHPLFSPIVNGFDLDAIVAMHLETSITTSVTDFNPQIFPTSYKNEFPFSLQDGETIYFYSLDGRLLFQSNTESGSFLTTGTFVLVIQSNSTIHRNVIQIY